MLIIINEGKYSAYKSKSSRMKPSEFCKCELKYQTVKSYEFVKKYFSDVNQLINSINEYKRVSNLDKSNHTLYDLIIDGE